MNISNFINRDVVSTASSSSIQEVAQIMQQNKVGSVVLTNDNNDASNPVGIITDRDIVLKIVSSDKNPSEISAREIMSDDLIKVRESADIFEALDLMSQEGVRRVPVVNDDNMLVGVISLDDILQSSSTMLNKLCTIVHQQSVN